jgi:hypothetical protein
MISLIYALGSLIVSALLLYEICKTYKRLTIGDLVLSFLGGLLWPFIIVGLVIIFLIHWFDDVTSKTWFKKLLNREVVNCKKSEES